MKIEKEYKVLGKNEGLVKEKELHAKLLSLKKLEEKQHNRFSLFSVPHPRLLTPTPTPHVQI